MKCLDSWLLVVVSLSFISHLIYYTSSAHSLNHSVSISGVGVETEVKVEIALSDVYLFKVNPPYEALSFSLAWDSCRALNWNFG